MAVTKCARRVAAADVTCDNERDPKALVTPRGRLTHLSASPEGGPVVSIMPPEPDSKTVPPHRGVR